MQKNFSNSVVMICDFTFVFYHFLKSFSWYFILVWASLFNHKIHYCSSLPVFYFFSLLRILLFAMIIRFCLFYCLFLSFFGCLPIWFLAHIIFREFHLVLHFRLSLSHHWPFHHDSPIITARILSNRLILKFWLILILYHLVRFS